MIKHCTYCTKPNGKLRTTAKEDATNKLLIANVDDYIVIKNS